MDPEKKVSDGVTVDNILSELGPFKLFNVLNFAMILFPVFLAGIYGSIYNFETIDLNYRCATPECSDDTAFLNYTIPHENGDYLKCVRYAPFPNATISNGQCLPNHFDSSRLVPCDSFVYLEDHSIVKEFDLGCQDWKRSLVGTVHNAGFFISIPLTGFISDRYGRRAAVIFASVSNGVFGVIRAFSVNYEMFVAFEFLEPAFGAGAYTACFVLGLELVGPKGRVLISLFFNTMFIVGGVTVTLLSWWLQNWRRLLFIIYAPSVFTFIYIWTLTESFRWLFSKKKYEEGFKVFKKAERINNVSIRKDHYDQVEKQLMKENDERKLQDIEANRSQFRQILTSVTIWRRLLICSLLWMMSTMVYYGLSINAIELSGNSYLNYIVIIVIEAPANICKFIFLDKYGRKKVIATAYFMTGLILINYKFVPVGIGSLIMYLGGKFFITLAYNSLYVFVAEVFPTNYRTTLFAACSTVGRVGSTLAPQTPLLAKIYRPLPTLLFGGMATMAGFLVLTLPETKNMKLPDSLKEAEEQDRKSVERTENHQEDKVQKLEDKVEKLEDKFENKTRL